MPQTSIGTGYDLLNSIFSPDGRNFQVEYAVKAVENGGTSIGIRCDEGVVLAVEKVVASKLAKAGANKRIGTVDSHIGVVRWSPHRLAKPVACFYLVLPVFLLTQSRPGRSTLA